MDSKKIFSQTEYMYFGIACSICVSGIILLLDDLWHIPINRLAVFAGLIICIITSCIVRSLSLTIEKKAVFCFFVIMLIIMLLWYKKIFDIISYAVLYSDDPLFKKNSLYDVLISLLFSILGYLITAIIIEDNKRFRFLTIVWMIVLIFCSINNLHISKYAVVSMVAILLISVIPNWRGFIPVSIVIMLVCCSFSYSNSPYKWTFALKAYEQLCHTFDKLQIGFSNSVLGDKEAGAFSMPGYSDSQSFGEGIGDNDTTQLSVKCTEKENNIYIIGAVYNVYDDGGWKKKYTDETYNENTVGVAEYLRAIYISGLNLDDLNEFTSLREIGITYENICTNTAFTVERQLEYNQESGESYQIIDGNTRFMSVCDRGFKFSLKYIDISMESEDLRGIISSLNAEKCDDVLTLEQYEEMNELCKSLYYVPLSDIASCEEINTYLLNRKQYITENYTELPDTISDRMINLVNDITVDCENDMEKVKAIEQYLQTFSYSKDMICVEGQSKLDTFLFETQEGYCVYFASAMAVMSRIAGIPSRYVEGFCLDYSLKSDTNEYKVSGNNAHAWVEVYIDGYGWLRMEPTPGYSDGTYTAWKIAAPQSSSTAYEPSHDQGDEVATATDAHVTQAVQKQFDAWKLVGSICKVLAILTGIVLLCVFAVRTILDIRYKLLSVEDKYWFNFKRLKKCLNRLLAMYTEETERTDNETMLEFFKRVKEYISGISMYSSEDKQAVIEKIDEVYREYESIRYGGVNIKDEHNDSIVALYRICANPKKSI